MKFSKCGTITIKGQDWEYGWGDAGKTKGVPDDAACSYKRKKIIISPKYTRSLIEIIPHEVAHAFFPRAKEKTILAFGACVEEVWKQMQKPSRRSR